MTDEFQYLFVQVDNSKISAPTKENKLKTTQKPTKFVKILLYYNITKEANYSHKAKKHIKVPLQAKITN